MEKRGLEDVRSDVDGRRCEYVNLGDISDHLNSVSQRQTLSIHGLYNPNHGYTISTILPLLLCYLVFLSEQCCIQQP
jgi:hypothetical protein